MVDTWPPKTFSLYSSLPTATVPAQTNANIAPGHVVAQMSQRINHGRNNPPPAPMVPPPSMFQGAEGNYPDFVVY